LKTKFILWLDSELLTFAIAYYLKKTYDCELYAIIDITNGTKDFFKKQQLVKFEKTWFYFDHVNPKKHESDHNYLKTVEKKFDLNLWNLAINERIFYYYNKFYKFSDNEILSIITQECQLFEKIIDEVKPDFFITKETIQHKDHLFYKMCKKVGITPLVCYESIIGYKCIISQKEHTIDFPKKFLSVENKYKTFEELQNYFKTFNKSTQVIDFRDEYMNSSLDRLKAATKFLLFSSNNNTKTHYTYFGRSKSRVFLSEFRSILRRKSREKFMKNNLDRIIQKDEKFLYFPLHLEQERSLLIAAPYCTNQIEIIRNIAKSLPIDYKLYVKEHPSQANRNWRSISDYKEIMNIPNVRLFHPSFPSVELYKKCSTVITINGSSGFEASLYGKPTIIFGDMGYSIMPSVIKIKDFENLSETIRETLLKKVDPLDVDRYISLLEENSIDFDWSSMSMKILNQFFYGGHLVDVDISIDEMKIFLEEHKTELEKLTSGFISKLKQFEKGIPHE
tara:strand:+ start:30 stop:1547 length:1518 start_codon:yes stop_codon:yes gene_type:complete